MTIAVPTLVEQQADLIDELNEVLRRHPIAASFLLMYAPRGLELAADEVLVQEVDTKQRIIALRPRRLSELDSGDVLHASQVVHPGDDTLTAHARQARARTCLMLSHDGGTTHLYS
ncbi:hypothetical protein [Streptomyces sp. NPDC002671]